jgi:hypothetical protein
MHVGGCMKGNVTVLTRDQHILHYGRQGYVPVMAC